MWKIENTPDVQKRKKEWVELNRERVSAQRKEFREKNKERLKQKQKKYMAKTKKYKSEYDKEYRSKNKDRVRNNLLKRQYGIDLIAYNKIFLDQKGCCKICSRHQSELSKILAVDHCHASKKVRGLLCNTCNTGLGNFRDNIESMKRAIKYLQA